MTILAIAIRNTGNVIKNETRTERFVQSVVDTGEAYEVIHHESKYSVVKAIYKKNNWRLEIVD